MWGVIAVGLFSGNPQPIDTTGGKKGLFRGKKILFFKWKQNIRTKKVIIIYLCFQTGGGWYFLGIQTLSVLSLLTWGMLSTFIILWLINKITPIRMDPNEELLGADLTEHNIKHGHIGLTRALSALAPANLELDHFDKVPRIGFNPGHEQLINELHRVS